MYHVVLGGPVDKIGLRTRMVAADLLEAFVLVETASCRPPTAYRLKDRAEPVFFPRTFSPHGGESG